MSGDIVINSRSRQRPRRVFESKRPAELAQIPSLRADMAKVLANAGVPTLVIEDLNLAVSEIATNAIQHGDPAPSTLGLAVDIAGDAILLEMTDDGGSLHFMKEFRPSDADTLEIDGPLLSSATMRVALDRFRYQTSDVNRFVGWRSMRLVQPIAFDEASHAVDCLYQATFGEGARVVGVIGTKSGDGASACAQALARRCALTGGRTLLLDVSGTSEDRGGSAMQVLLHRDGYEVVTLHPQGNELFVHRSQDVLRQLLSKVYSEFQAIVVDCAPTSTRKDDPIPGPVMARCVDATLLVCLAGSTTKQSIADAKRALEGVSIRGVVVNRRDQVTLGEELARQAMRTARFFPSLARAVASRYLRARFLDVHI